MRWLASKKPESSGRWHVSTVTVRHSIVQKLYQHLKNENPSRYRIIKKRQSSRQNGIKRRIEISLGLEVRQDGSSWPWDPFLRPVTASKDGRGLNDQEWLDLEDARFCELGFLFVSWASFLTNSEIEDLWTDYTCCFLEIINLDLGDRRETFSLVQTWSRSIDLQNKLHLYYWNCEFKSWWLVKRLLDLDRRGI